MPRQVNYRRQQHERTYRKAARYSEENNESGTGGGGGSGGNGSSVPGATINDALNALDANITAVEADVVALDSSKADKIIEITGGEGLSGGGDLSANRELALDINSLTVDSSPDKAADYVATYDDNAASHKKVLLQNLGADELNDLTDVSLTSPAHNDVLVFVVTTHELILSGDMDAGTGDNLLLSGDMQAGTDQLSLSGDDSSTSIWQNVPFASLPLA